MEKGEVIFLGHYFIYGIIFTLIGLPLLQTLSDIIITVGEVIKGKLAIKVTKFNKEIAEISGEEEQQSTSVIGFIAPEEKEEEDEDYED